MVPSLRLDTRSVTFPGFPRLTGGSSEQGDKCQDEILEVPGAFQAVNCSSPGRQRMKNQIQIIYIYIYINILYVCLSSDECSFFMNDWVHIIIAFW